MNAMATITSRGDNRTFGSILALPHTLPTLLRAFLDFFLARATSQRLVHLRLTLLDVLIEGAAMCFRRVRTCEELPSLTLSHKERTHLSPRWLALARIGALTLLFSLLLLSLPERDEESSKM